MSEKTELFQIKEFVSWLILEKQLSVGSSNCYKSYILTFSKVFGSVLPHPSQFEKMVDDHDYTSIQSEFDNFLYILKQEKDTSTPRIKTKTISNIKSALSMYSEFLIGLSKKSNNFYLD